MSIEKKGRLSEQDQEIDILHLANKFLNFFEWIQDIIFFGVLFIRKNILALIVLAIAGFSLGYYFDREKSAYEHQVIVSPNMGSAEYLYSQISLLNSKVDEKDFDFLTQSVGIKNAKRIKRISIKPIVDLYKISAQNSLQTNNYLDAVSIRNANQQNVEMIKIFSEKYDIKDILKDSVASKNYPYHKIELLTSNKIGQDEIIDPILAFLNKSDYFDNIKKQRVENLKLEIRTTDSIVKQIDYVINSLREKAGGLNQESKLLYNNENVQLDKMIKTKDSIVVQQGIKKINLLQLDKVIKDNGIIINKKSTKGLNNKMRYFLMTFFVFTFFFGKFFISFYSKRKAKHQLK